MDVRGDDNGDEDLFGEAVKNLGRTKSLDELKKRGIDCIRSVSSAEISRLIDRAVNKTLLERTLEARPEEVREMVAQARSRMQRLLALRDDLRDRRDEVSAFRDQFDREVADIREGDERDGAGGLFERHLVQKLRGVFRDLRRDPDPLGAERRAIEVALEAFQAARAGAVAGGSEAASAFERDRRIDVLERRIAKLMSALEASEQALGEALACIDDGLPSAHRGVAGLEPDDPRKESKLGFLKGVFDDNVGLQKSS